MTESLCAKDPRAVNSGFKECTAQGPISNISITQLVTVHAIVPSAPDFCLFRAVHVICITPTHQTSKAQFQQWVRLHQEDPALSDGYLHVSSQRFGEHVAEGWPTNLDRNVLQVHTSLNANGIVAGQRFRTSLQVPAYAMICPGFMLIFVWYLASSAFISSSEARASATTEPTNQPPKPSDPKDKLRMAASQGIPVLIHLDREHLIPWLLVQSSTIDHKSI